MAIIRIGVDLAKNVFAVHGVVEAGKLRLARTVRREQLLEVLAAVPPCIVAMEACSGAHHWARRLLGLGHTSRLLAPKFVAPYRMSGRLGKNDAHDAAAICKAAGRPALRFAPMKAADQQALLSVHRVRQGFVEERTATINRLRGLLSEFGIVLPLKSVTVRHQAARHLEALPVIAQRALGDLLAHLTGLDGRIDACDTQLTLATGDDDRARQLMSLRGVGPLGASAIVATVGARVQEWPLVRCLAGHGAAAVQQRRQATAGAHHQGRRCRSAHAADHGGAGGAGLGRRANRPHQPLG